MKSIILIQAHKNAVQLKRLIQALRYDGFGIYVNLDAKSTISGADLGPDINLVSRRIDVRWGDFSIVQATLNSFEEIHGREPSYDYIVFISGQDYPCWSNEAIKGFLEKAGGRQYVTCMPLCHGGWEEARSRFEWYHYRGASRFWRLYCRAGNALLRMLNKKRPFYRGLQPYAGSQWCILSRDCIGYILDFVKKNKSYAAYMNLTNCSDELFFQSILCNSAFKDRIVNENYRYIDWSDCAQGMSYSPNLLGARDFDAIIGSGKMFCRKVELDFDSEIFDMLDAYRGTAGNHGGGL